MPHLEIDPLFISVGSKLSQPARSQQGMLISFRLYNITSF